GYDGRKWIKTKVNIEDHVVVPNVDLDKIGQNGDEYVGDYISRLTMITLDKSTPLWDIHILNVKTSDAEAVTVIRTHHSLGDATSLMSLLVASTRKTSDPKAFPTIPALKRRGTTSFSLINKNWFMKFIFTMCNALILIWNTVIDVLLVWATILFLKDTETPLHSRKDTGSNLRRFYHRTVSLDDIRLIKKAMNMTINDVLLGVTQASVSRYMNCRYGNRKPEDGIRIRSGVAINLRSEVGLQPLADMMSKGSKCRWGNYVSLFLFPFSTGLETDPLVYLSKTKSTMDGMKNSLLPTIIFWSIKSIFNILGDKIGAVILKRTASNTTLCLSNVTGPIEEVSFKGHPIAYIALSTYGHSQALFIHFTSYAKDMVISIAIDPMVIPDPQELLDEMEDSLKAMKATLFERGLL
ncbi:unnamed protein product, partial [Thlaspi arvense]